MNQIALSKRNSPIRLSEEELFLRHKLFAAQLDKWFERPWVRFVAECVKSKQISSHGENRKDGLYLTTDGFKLGIEKHGKMRFYSIHKRSTAPQLMLNGFSLEDTSRILLSMAQARGLQPRTPLRISPECRRQDTEKGYREPAAGLSLSHLKLPNRYEAHEAVTQSNRLKRPDSMPLQLRDPRTAPVEIGMALNFVGTRHFKPTRRSLEGKGEFTVTRAQDGSVTIIAKSKDICDKLKPSANLFQRVRNACATLMDTFKPSRMRRRTFGIPYEPQGYMKVKCRTTSEACHLIDGLVKRDSTKYRPYIIQNSLPLERINGRKVEMRFVFEKNADRRPLSLRAYHTRDNFAGFFSKINHFGKGENLDETLSQMIKRRYKNADPAIIPTVESLKNQLIRKVEKCFDEIVSTRNPRPLARGIYAVDVSPVWNEAELKFDFYLIDICDGASSGGIILTGMRGNRSQFRNVRQARRF